MDATSDRGDDGSVAFDAEPRDGPTDAGDTASDSERRFDVTGRYHFPGAIDEVAVYDKALSMVQVTMHRDIALRR